MIDSAIECAEIGLRILRRANAEQDKEKRIAMLIDAQRWIGKTIFSIGLEKDDGKTEASDTGSGDNAGKD